MKHIKIRIALTVLIVTFTSTVLGEIIELNPIKDNTLYETNTGDTSNGAGDRLFIGKTGGNAGNKIRRAVLAFDLSDIPANSTINSASLDVTVTNVAPGAPDLAAGLHLMLSDWGEGTSNGSGNGAASTQDDATWIHSFYDQTMWDQPGGDFALVPISGTGFFASNNNNGIVTFDSSFDMVTDVQFWLENPSMNYGWIILGDEILDQSARGISSREGTNPPTLTIDYTPDIIFEDGFEQAN